MSRCIIPVQSYINEIVLNIYNLSLSFSHSLLYKKIRVGSLQANKQCTKYGNKETSKMQNITSIELVISTTTSAPSIVSCSKIRVESICIQDFIGRKNGVGGWRKKSTFYALLKQLFSVKVT